MLQTKVVTYKTKHMVLVFLFTLWWNYEVSKWIFRISIPTWYKQRNRIDFLKDNNYPRNKNHFAQQGLLSSTPVTRNVRHASSRIFGFVRTVRRSSSRRASNLSESYGSVTTACSADYTNDPTTIFLRWIPALFLDHRVYPFFRPALFPRFFAPSFSRSVSPPRSRLPSIRVLFLRPLLSSSHCYSSRDRLGR